MSPASLARAESAERLAAQKQYEAQNDGAALGRISYEIKCAVIDGVQAGRGYVPDFGLKTLGGPITERAQPLVEAIAEALDYDVVFAELMKLLKTDAAAPLVRAIANKLAEHRADAILEVRGV